MDTFLFILSKVIVPFFSPLFLILLVLVVLLVRMRRNAENRRVRFWLLVLCFVTYAAACPLLSAALVRWWEVPASRDLPEGVAASPRWDVAVVLGGGLDPRLSEGWELSVNDAADRLESAARLWHQGLVKTVIVSGGSGDIHNQDKLEGPRMKRLLEGMGVPPAAILVDDSSRNTFENATNSLPLAASTGGTSLVLVTSALHMRRAEAIFRKAVAAFPLSGDGRFRLDVLSVDSRQFPLSFPESLIPDASSLDILSRVVREITGYGYYFVLGRL